MVTRSLVINEATRLWQVHINGHPVDPVVVPQLVDLPAKVNSTSASVLLHYLTMLKTCAGNPDPTYVALGKSKKNAKFMSADGKVVAYLDSNACVYVGEECYPVTVRCSACHLLTDTVHCDICHQFRHNLCAQHSRSLRIRSASKNTNYR